jgi:hypothetical protein
MLNQIHLNHFELKKCQLQWQLYEILQVNEIELIGYGEYEIIIDIMLTMFLTYINVVEHDFEYEIGIEQVEI